MWFTRLHHGIRCCIMSETSSNDNGAIRLRCGAGLTQGTRGLGSISRRWGSGLPTANTGLDGSTPHSAMRGDHPLDMACTDLDSACANQVCCGGK